MSWMNYEKDEPVEHNKLVSGYDYFLMPGSGGLTGVVKIMNKQIAFYEGTGDCEQRLVMIQDKKNKFYEIKEYGGKKQKSKKAKKQKNKLFIIKKE